MTDIKYMSSKDAAEILNLTVRRIVGLCNEGKLEGAFQKGRGWKIPVESVNKYMVELSVKKGTPGTDYYGSEISPSFFDRKGYRTLEEEKAEYITVKNRNGYADFAAAQQGSSGILTCAVGNTSFAEVVQNSYYVDKTLLIRDLIDDQTQVILFTRPRRFGKTLALDMLKCFFEKTDEDTSVYFRNKKIWECGDKYRNRQGTYPVISITFKDAKFSNWVDTREAIRNVVRDEYLRHAELFSDDSLNLVEKDYLDRLQAGTLSEVEYTRALLNLSRMLEKIHACKAVILIDEYDTPIQQGHLKGFYNEVITFMRNFMSAGLKDNPSLSFGVLTGILRVSKENLFSGLNNLIVNSVLDTKYSSYFGFTTDEIEEMARYYGKAEKTEEIREWYDGYLFGNTEIYNPWSVANYFYNEFKARPYWVNTSDNAIIHEILAALSLEIAENLFSLLQGKTVQTVLNTDVIYPKIADGPDSIFSFLLIAGYLKPVGAPVETDFGTFMELALPNKEIRRVYNTEILSWIRETFGDNVMAGLEKALYLNDGGKLKELLRKYMVTCISYFDGAAEGFYHGMMLGLAAGMSSKYYIRSNRESGDGRFDLVLEPRNHGLPGVIMEFKAVKDDTQLSDMAYDAFKQIDEKHYDTDLRDRGVTDISEYGIAFCGKKVEIVTEGLKKEPVE